MIRSAKDAEKSFLAAGRQKGLAKKKVGAKSTEEIIKKVLLDDTVEYFRKILPDDLEQKLWAMFLDGRIPMMDKDGEHVRDRNGVPQFHEITGVSWNAFKQMVAYKRGMPAIKVESKPGSEQITVNFNVMGASPQTMERQVRELGLLPESGS